MENQVFSDKREQKRQILVVTGLSGAGKNVVMRALEDLGFYCVDNLPIPLLSTFVHFAFNTSANLVKVALGIDARGEKFLKDFLKEIEKIELLDHERCSLKVIYLQADKHTLLRRFEETRRKHPLGRTLSLPEALKKEKEMLAPLIDRADIILNTDTLHIHQLRQWVRNSFSTFEAHQIMLNLISFGFKYGIPSESNLLFDVRFLPNPFFVPALKHLDGTTSEIQNFLFAQRSVEEYTELLFKFITYSLEKYLEEGRPFVNIAIGCTGGKHRSVCIIEHMRTRSFPHTRIVVHHRDVKKA